MAVQEEAPGRPDAPEIESDFFGADDYVARADSYDDVWADSKKSNWDSRVHAALAVGMLGALGVAFAWLGVPTGADATPTIHHHRVTAPKMDNSKAAQEARQVTPTPRLNRRALAAFGGRPLPPEEQIEGVHMSPRLLAVLSGDHRNTPRAANRPATRRAAGPKTQRARPADTSTPPKPSFKAAVALYDAGKGREAIPVLQRLVRSGQANEDSLLLLGSIYHELGRETETKRAYQAYLQRFPNGSHAEEIRGILARR